MSKVAGLNTSALRKGDPEPPLARGRARIYAFRFSPFAERLVLYAAAKGIEVEVVNIVLADKPDWYMDKHPQGKEPAFEYNGKVLTESAIIPEWMDALFPASSILPADPYLRAKQKIILEQTAPLTTFLALIGVYNGTVTGEEAAARVKTVEEALDVVEKLLVEDYFGGTAPGYADWMLFPALERVVILSSAVSLAFPSAARWPALSTWWARISGHPAVVAVIKPPAVHLGFLKTLGAGSPDPDYGI